MTNKEALDLMNGKRSSVNYTQNYPQKTWQERIAKTDAAMMEQAYWYLKAEKEGLLETLND